jgi:hypothetical protein
VRHVHPHQRQQRRRRCQQMQQPAAAASGSSAVTSPCGLAAAGSCMRWKWWWRSGSDGEGPVHKACGAFCSCSCSRALAECPLAALWRLCVGRVGVVASVPAEQTYARGTACHAQPACWLHAACRQLRVHPVAEHCDAAAVCCTATWHHMLVAVGHQSASRVTLTFNCI